MDSNNINNNCLKIIIDIVEGNKYITSYSISLAKNKDKYLDFKTLLNSFKANKIVSEIKLNYSDTELDDTSFR